MAKQPTRFQQARLKLVWADHHIGQLQAIWDAYCKTDFCKVVIQDHPEGGQEIRIVSVDPLPAEMVLTLGDAVHNLRSVLDYVVSEVLHWKDTRLTFPMGETREELVSAFSVERGEPCAGCGRGSRKGRYAAVETAIPGIAAFIIDEIRPYKAADGLLWPLNKLDVRDKHRLLIPVLVPQTITLFNVRDKNNNSIGRATVSIGPGGSQGLMRSDAGGIKVERYGEPTAEIFLNEPGIIEGQPLFPTLLNMSKAVAQTVTRFEEFLDAREA
nr:hypothetical protein [uncultured Brevundimonas sp.]